MRKFFFDNGLWLRFWLFWKITFRLTILICMNQDKQSLLSDISGRLHLDQQLSFASERGETESLPPPSDLWVYERVLGVEGTSRAPMQMWIVYSWGLTNPNGWREMSGGSVSANGNKAFHVLLWYFEYCICLEMHGSPIRQTPPPMRGSLGAAGMGKRGRSLSAAGHKKGLLSSPAKSATGYKRGSSPLSSPMLLH